MNKFKILWKAVLSVFFVCCIQTYSQAQEPCALPVGLDIITTLSVSGPGFCEYDLSLDADTPIEQGVYCADWFYGGSFLGSGPLTSSVLIECDGEPLELCARVYCCDNPDMAEMICEPIIADCCADPCEPLSVEPLLMNVSTPNIPCELRLELSGLSSYCKEWYVDGVLFSSGIDENSFVLTGCENDGPHDICVRVFCCDTGEVVWDFCDSYLLECEPCPCDDVYPILNVSMIDYHCYYQVSVSGLTPDVCLDYQILYNGSPYLPFSTDPLIVGGCEYQGIFDVTAIVTCCETGEVLWTQNTQLDVVCDCCEPLDGVTILAVAATADCTYSFTANLLGATDPSLYCYDWTLNGVSIGSTATVNHTFECDDNNIYQLCVRVICCETGEYAGDACITFTPDCECPCELPTDYQIASSIDADNCDYTFEIDPFLISSADYCVTWSLDGGPFVSDLTPGDITLSFDCEDNGGHYVCARIFCCDKPDEFVERCVDFVVECECPCDPISGVQILNTQISNAPCVYRFDALFPVPVGTDMSQYCYRWTLDGVSVGGNNSSFEQEFPCPDSQGHVVCVDAICCETGEVLAHTCVDFVSECSCCDQNIIPGINVDQDGCIYTFTPTNNGIPLVADGDYCWDWSNPTSQNPDGSITIDFSGQCLEFDLSVKIFCCTGMDFGLLANIVVPIECCCDPTDLPTGDFLVDPTAGSCGYVAAVSFPAGTDIDHLCFNWSLDGVGVVSSNGNFHTFDFDCTQNGWHLICVTYTCCENLGEPTEICTEIFVDCPCTHPFLLLADVEDCRVCLTPVYEGPCPAQVMYYDYGDGQTGIDPCHEYTLPGVYTTCVTTCCTSNLDAAGNPIDPTLCETICTQVVIEVDCCELPVDPQIFISKTEDCLHFFELASLTGFSDNICVEWSLDSGPWQPYNYNLIDFQHQFNCHDGVNHSIRVRIFCCDNPDEKVIVDQDFEINCSCILPSSVFFNHTIDDECQLIVETTWTSDYCGDICYDLYVDNVLVANNTSPVIVAQGTGVYDVCVYVYCCTNPNEQLEYCEVIEVNCEGCPCDIHAFWQETAIGNNVQFTDFSEAGAGTTITSWSWNFGDPGSGATNVSNLQHPSHFYANAGTYIVTLTVCGHDENGVECCDTFVWRVSTECFAECKIEASLDYYFMGDNDCSIQFLDQSTTGVGTTIASWFWDFGDGTTSGLQNPVHTYNTSGVYSVRLVVTGWNGVTYCESYIKKEIEVHCENGEPCEGDPHFKYKTSGCAAKFYDYSVVSGIVTNINWNFGDGSPSVNGPSILIHNFPGSGTYPVTITITFWNGSQLCALSYTEHITLQCGIIVDNDDPQGLVIEDLNVYPNPTSDKVMIDVLGWEMEELVTVKVTTVTGEVLKTAQFDLSNGPLEISLDEFESGFYNISVSNNREIFTSRVVKE